MAENLQRLHQLQLLNLLELKRICDKYNIRYTPIGGSLIGVVRHHGFIPWDDDIDIGMLRDDYEKFLAVAPVAMSDKFFLQNMQTDPNFFHPLTRICLKNTVCEAKWAEGVDMHHEIYIDVFPYDASPENKLCQIVHALKIKILKLLLTDKHHRISTIKIKYKPFVFSIHVLSKLCSKEWLVNTLESVIMRYNNSDSKYVVRTASQYPYNKVRILRTLMEEMITMKFENFDISVMKGYHEHLTENYGNYMQLPPEDKRISNLSEVFAKLDFKEYNNDKVVEQMFDNYRACFLKSEK